MFKNTKNAFWEALLLTALVFFVGVLIGISYEGTKLEEINNYYDISQISLMDAFALGKLVESSDDCSLLINAHLDFADRIYHEAFLLEKYEESEKLTEGLRLAHKKYDLMRTLLWMDASQTLNKCSADFSIIVYLYEYETEDLVKKAENNVWSKILFDLKQKKGNEIILIPIAVDSDLISLNSRIDDFDIVEYPVVLINNKHVIAKISSVDDLIEYLE